MSRTSGGSFSTEASLLSQTDDLGSTGVKTHTVNLASAAAVNATDTMYFLLVFGDQILHGNTTVVITMGQNIVTPLDAGAGLSIPVAMASYRRRNQSWSG